jgi:hypothetical protein
MYAARTLSGMRTGSERRRRLSDVLYRPRSGIKRDVRMVGATRAPSAAAASLGSAGWSCEPWDIGTMSRNRKWPRLLAYGDLELSVCRCRQISLICIQTWRDVVELPPSVVGGTGTFPAGLKHADVISALDKASCPWQPYPPLTFGDQCSLEAIPTGANFTFEIPEGDEPVLNVMSLPGDGHDCSARNDRPSPLT